MPTLSSNIVKREIASVKDVEEALARQSLYGGDLVTNLLELARVSEEHLTRAVAESVGLEPAPAGELPSAAERVRRLVPRDIAHRYALYPLNESEGRLIVAVSEPLPGDVASDLEFSLGLALEQRVAPLVRVQEAVCRDYGVDLDQRVARVLARLNGTPDPHPTEPPNAGLSALLRAEDDSIILPTETPSKHDTLAAPPEPGSHHKTLVVPAEPSAALSVAVESSKDSSPSSEERITTPGADAMAAAEATALPTEVTAAPEAPAEAPAPPAELTAAPEAPAPPTEVTAAPEASAPPTEVTTASEVPAQATAAPETPRPESPRPETPKAPSPSPYTSLPSLAKLDLAAIARAESRATRRRRLGPYTPAMAETDLSQAEGMDVVMGAFFDFAAQYFEYSALFAVHGDLAEGRDAHGPGAPRARVLTIGVPLDLPSSLASALAPNEPYRLARLAASGLDGALAKDLERRPGKSVLLLPVRVRERPVLLLYGDHGSSDVDLETVGDLLSFAPLVSGAIERLIRQRKGAAARAPSLSLRLPMPSERPKAYPDAQERALALATALVDAPLAPVARISVTPVISIGSQLAGTPGNSEPPLDLTADAVEVKKAAPQSRRSLTPVQMPPPPSGPPASAPGSDPPANAAPKKLSESGRKLELVRDPDSLPPDAPELSIEEAPIDSSIEALLAENASIPAMQPAQSRSVALAAHPLPPPGHTEELRLPSVIVDLANDTEALVEKLVRGDASAGERLLQLGAAAVPALVGAFPGPILAELRRTVGDGPARASECGPLLKVLVRIGPRAAPVLGVRTNDSRADVRAWATRLLGEMPCSDASRAVARRFLDEDSEVRRAALAAGRMLEGNAAAGEALASTLTEMLLDSARKAAQIHMLIEAVADLREARAIPALAALLASGSSEVQRSAHWALTVLARTDYGDNSAAWDQWWRLNSSRHRIEWLIDALMHESAEIRRAAGDELKSVTKEYFGYYDDLPARERERAQRRYREWWETKGKARFLV